MVNNIGNGIQERYIMRNKDKRILIALQISGKPLNMLNIKIVGRLVKN